MSAPPSPPEPGSRPPKSFQVKQRLAAEVLDRLDTGAALPTERDLAARYDVSRMTVRQAIRELRLEGRVRRQGRSTVVGGPKLVQPLTLASYTEGVRRQGRTPGRVPLSFEAVPASPAAARTLGLPPGARAIRLERLLLADEERIGLECTWLPLDRFPALLAEFDPATSLYAHLRAVGVVLAEADERIETVLATPREVELIGTSPALPMLLVNRVTRDDTGRTVESLRTVYRGDRLSFTARLTPDS